MTNRFCTIAAMLLAAPACAQVADRSERDYQRTLCAGMDVEVLVPEGGGRADCSDGVHIIEIDWTDGFKHGVGQVLTYATKSDLVPGLVLICRRSKESCLQHALIAEETLTAVGFQAVIWRCGNDAMALSDCLEIRLAAKP